ncbi:hypothetical protein ZYGR_0N07640 [Zygosaccharomyces rouxii]|uniref:ZYRO0D17776p n=2 Tax=Zygosaccharomyces rouxii TaxID=4956 RepID=C5DWV0_ZYGRC|nr:uncharacterized protein ZYRO0D17776g [Zygosaccharomyces rouxii]KAH9201179.1 Sodium:solute symporter family-domain-containing protein [Zygosaccharomyces rouxii]GAV49357.1 hypothetical protein ZYGR_0N07640 [Zygosaccharomyces rouxii]CAR28269.1 ZYRO0D17776p [Zygosaccharomyces rouxii]
MHPSLSQGVGYGVIVGLGAFFAVVMNIVTLIQNKFSRNKVGGADEFTAASRNVPLPLMIVSIVSTWCWSLTLLQSATESYSYGVSGGYLYAVGGAIQVSVFSIVASKVKANANLVTTFPEAGHLRFGTAGHLTYLWCGLSCNTIVSSVILLGGSAVFNAVTGMNSYAALYLLPMVCAVYVYFGGLRATFISDACHTFPLLVFLIIFTFVIYCGGSSKIGSPGKMWELLSEVAHHDPVDSNYHGSFLTFRSKDGGIFLFITIITGFGIVVLDQAYWSRAIASQSLKTSKAYFIGACCWFVIPWSMGLVLGLGARATSLMPGFPSLNSDEVTAGLSAVAGASFLLGKAGSTMILLMIFLSVTSAFSGELIATSTLLSYDVYKKYLKKDATPQQVLFASKVSVFLWAAFAGGIACVFQKIGISMGWLFNFYGCATSSGVFPVALTFTWSKLNKWGAVSGCLAGTAIALAVWLGTCKAIMGEINVDNLSDRWVSFAGNATALFSGGIISIVVSLIWPQEFDWNDIRNKSILTANEEKLIYEQGSGEVTELEEHHITNPKDQKAVEETGQHGQSFTSDSSKDDEGNGDDILKEEEREEYCDLEGSESLEEVEIIDVPQEENIPLTKLNKQFKVFSGLALAFAFAVSVCIPVPQIAAPYVYSKGFFTFVVIANIIWLFITFSVCVIWPLFETRKFIYGLFNRKKKIRNKLNLLLAEIVMVLRLESE